MEMNVIDAWKQEKGLTDVEAVSEIKSMGFSDEMIALFRKTNSEVTDDERKTIMEATEIISEKMGASKDRYSMDKKIVINVVELGDHFATKVESDFDNKRTSKMLISFVLSQLEQRGADVSGLVDQLTR